MNLGQNFINDTSGKNTQLYPLVDIHHEISKIHISTHTVTVDGNYYKPILLNIPSVKEKIDVHSKNFTISSVSLDVSNIVYEGSRFSDILHTSSLINTTVAIYIKSPNTNNIKNLGSPTTGQSDCPRVYTGVIRKITHNDVKAKIDIEDLTEKKAHKDLLTLALTGDDVIDKFKNKSVPMVYGNVDRSPVVIKSGHLIPDSRTIKGYNTYVNKYTIGYDDDGVSHEVDETILVNINNSYCAVPNTIIKDTFFTTEDGFTEQDSAGEEVVYSVGDAQVEEVDSVFNFTKAKLISLNVNPLLNHDMMQLGHTSKASMFEMQKQVPIGDGEGFSPTDTVNNYEFETLNEEELQNISDDNANTSVNVYPQVYTDPDYYVWQGSSNTVSGLGDAGGMRLTFKNAGGVNFTRRSTAVSVNGIVVKKAYGGDILGFGSFDVEPYDPNLASEYPNVVAQGENGNDYVGLFTYSQSEYNNGNRDFLLKYETGTLDGVGDDMNFGTFVPVNSLISSPDNFLAICGNRPAKISAYEGSNDITVGTVNPTSAYLYGRFDYDFRFKEFESYVYGNIENPFANNFYVNIGGRTNVNPISSNIPINSNIGINSLIQNPIDIIYDLVVAEIGHDKIDEVEYAEAKAAHQWVDSYNVTQDWKFAFTLTKKINSKTLIQEIAKSTKCFPKFKNDGSFGFNVIKDTYNDTDIDAAEEINTSDVISYSFKKTKPESIYRKVKVFYNKDYEQDTYLDSTNFHDLGSSVFYAIENSADASLEFESDFIRDEYTANRLRDFLLNQHKNDHLLINLKLPIKFISLEVGQLIKFPNMFNDTSGYGIQYSHHHDVNGQMRFPLFMITSTNKNLNTVSIECMQLHYLDGVLEDVVVQPEEEGDDFIVDQRPVITPSYTNLVVDVFDTFDLPTATVVDDNDVNIQLSEPSYYHTHNVEFLSNNQARAVGIGDFTISWSAEDSSGNISTAYSYVNIIQSEEATNPESTQLTGFFADAMNYIHYGGANVYNLLDLNIDNAFWFFFQTEQAGGTNYPIFVNHETGQLLDLYNENQWEYFNGTQGFKKLLQVSGLPNPSDDGLYWVACLWWHPDNPIYQGTGMIDFFNALPSFGFPGMDFHTIGFPNNWLLFQKITVTKNRWNFNTNEIEVVADGITTYPNNEDFTWLSNPVADPNHVITPDTFQKNVGVYIGQHENANNEGFVDPELINDVTYVTSDDPLIVGGEEEVFIPSENYRGGIDSSEAKNLTIGDVPTTPVIGYLQGDVNLDGFINILDVVRLVNMILGTVDGFGEDSTEFEQMQGDFNQDGSMNILDVVGLVNRILGTD